MKKLQIPQMKKAMKNYNLFIDKITSAVRQAEVIVNQNKIPIFFEYRGNKLLCSAVKQDNLPYYKYH